jgi:integrase
LNELAKLEEDEVSDDMISLPGARVKNGRPHDVPLAPLARDILAGVERIPNCKFVFSTTGKSPISGFSKLKTRIGKLMADSGVEVPPWRFHDLRRTAATRMGDIGVLPHVIEAALNHVSGAKASVAGIYNRALYASEKRDALERWADRVKEIVS